MVVITVHKALYKITNPVFNLSLLVRRGYSHLTLYALSY